MAEPENYACLEQLVNFGIEIRALCNTFSGARAGGAVEYSWAVLELREAVIDVNQNDRLGDMIRD